MALALTAPVAGAPRRGTLHRAALSPLGPSDMRRHSQAAKILDEVARVVGTVHRKRGWSPDAALQHRQRGLAFRLALGLSQLNIDDQPVPVLGQRKTHPTDLGFLPRALEVELRLGLGGRPVRLAAAPRLARDLFHQHPRHIGFQEPLAVLRERRRLERLVLDPSTSAGQHVEVQEPLEEDRATHLVAELALRANCAVCHKETRLGQVLGRERGPSTGRLELIEYGRPPRQQGVDKGRVPPQRVVLGQEPVWRQPQYQRRLSLCLAAHCGVPSNIW